MDDPALAEPDRCGPGRSAGDDPSVASRGLESFLALELSKAGRAPEDRSWPARSHPTDQQGKPAVGRVPDPWRDLDAGVRGCPVDGVEVHGAGSVAVARLEDILPEPRAGDTGRSYVSSADPEVSVTVRGFRAWARPA